ncbi:MAG: ATP-binding protein [Sedimentisphaerales bacterium]
MLEDLIGRINKIKLAPHRGLLPLFEAVVNSIHAVKQRNNKTGKIDIVIRRNTSQGKLKDDLCSNYIREFEIIDNGIGFDNSNFDSFCIADSRYKEEHGGKGIGRMMWLIAFEKAVIKSSYVQDEKCFLRTFEFERTSDGVDSKKVKLIEQNNKLWKTSVQLTKFQNKFAENTPKTLDAIAKALLSHCFQYFMMDSCPQITLIDETENEKLNLNEKYKNITSTKSEKYKLGKHNFEITHVCIPRSIEDKHALYFCAHKRSVREDNLKNRIPNLPSSVQNEDGSKFVYAGYISGEYLDKNVNLQRTGFDLITDDIFNYPDEMKWEDISNGALEKANNFLADFTKETKKEKDEKIKEFVEKEAYQYRALIKHKPEVLDRISPDVVKSKNKLDLELYKLNQEYDLELNQKYKEILDDKIEIESIEGIKKYYSDFLEEWNEHGISALAQYIVHRKATLDFLGKSIRKQNDGRYTLEEGIHEVIFPLRCTSDDIPQSRMNLWIIDETLAYHKYLASDKYIDKIDIIDSNAHKRADLLIFQHPFAFNASPAPNFGSIFIVEFKRPSRDDYIDSENPITQISEYIEYLRSGRAKDKDGKQLNVPNSIPIHVTIICTVTPTLTTYAKRADFTQSIDGYRYFKFHKEYHAFIEIMSFETMLDNAKKRNAILFDKLGINNHEVIEESNEDDQIVTIKQLQP